MCQYCTTRISFLYPRPWKKNFFGSNLIFLADKGTTDIDFTLFDSNTMFFHFSQSRFEGRIENVPWFGRQDSPLRTDRRVGIPRGFPRTAHPRPQTASYSYSGASESEIRQHRVNMLCLNRIKYFVFWWPIFYKKEKTFCC